MKELTVLIPFGDYAPYILAAYGLCALLFVRAMLKTRRDWKTVKQQRES